ncbi:MAG: hypothetical protein FWE76_08390, partial [Symbiobacteriaceae bacterium]|nr:hypothetical protein [Symbiobacteriaceae bacterium]
MNTSELKAIYSSHLAELLSDADTWLGFQQFAGRHYKHSFANQVVLHAQDPYTTYIGTYKQWTSLAGRSVKPDAPSRTVYAGLTNPYTPLPEVRLATVYDVYQTHGPYDTLPDLYPLTPHKLELLITRVDNHEAINDYDEFLGILLRKAARETRAVLSDLYKAGYVQPIFDDEEFIDNFILPAVAVQIEEHRSTKGRLSFTDIDPYLWELSDDPALAYAVGTWITRIHHEAVFTLGEISESLEYPLLGDKLMELVLSTTTSPVNVQIPPAFTGSASPTPQIISPAVRAPQEPLPSPEETDEGNLTKIFSAVSVDSQQSSTPDTEPVEANLTKVIPEDFTPSQQLTTDPSLPDLSAPEVVPANFVIPDDFDQGGGPKAKFKQNIQAIQLLRQLESEERSASCEEQLILAKYAGWGGLPQAFDPLNQEWQSECTELALLLNEVEYRDARRSITNSHYTSVEVIDAIYAALAHFGYQGGGNVLEPSMGVGNFFGRLPDHLS